MRKPNRLMLQFSLLAIVASFSTAPWTGVATAASAKVAKSDPNWTPEQRTARRVLLRYSQLWNMYRFRNDGTMTPDQAAKVEKLITDIQPPKLHADMPATQIHAAIRANAVELVSRLRTEIARGAAPEAARANLAYLQGTLLKGLGNPKQYTMSDRKFSEEFAMTLADDPSLPDSITNRQSPGSVFPTTNSETRSNGVSQ